MSDNPDQKITELLTEIAKWARFNGIRAARDALAILQKDSEKIAYQYSDGRGSAEVAKLSGLSDFTIRTYWKKWNGMGIVVPSPKFKGRFERVFSLEDFGIEVPLIKASEVASNAGPTSNDIVDNKQSSEGKIENESR